MRRDLFLFRILEESSIKIFRFFFGKFSKNGRTVQNDYSFVFRTKLMFTRKEKIRSSCAPFFLRTEIYRNEFPTFTLVVFHTIPIMKILLSCFPIKFLKYTSCKTNTKSVSKKLIPCLFYVASQRLNGESPIIQFNTVTWGDLHHRGLASVSYTHLTLPTICSV